MFIEFFDDGTGNYTGIFSENFVDDLTKYAGNTPEDAPIISLDPQNNQELFISDNGTTIVNSKTGSVEAFRTKAEFRSASAFKPVDISDKTSFFVKPQTRATSYNYMLNINILETQGSTNWYFAYVTATALRYKDKNVRASTITNYLISAHRQPYQLTMRRSIVKQRVLHMMEGTQALL